MYTHAFRRRGLTALACLGLVSAPLALGLTSSPVAANPAGTGLVINEVYGGGGNAGATLKSDFVELKNTSASPVSLTGKSLQYRSAAAVGATGSSNLFPLPSVIVPAGQTYVVKAADGTGGTTAVAGDATSTLALSGTGGQVFLATTASAIDPNSPAGAAGQSFASNVIDFVGWGTTTTSWEGTTATTTRGPATANATSVSRNAAGADTDVNGSDFSVLATPTPTTCSGCTPDTGGGTGTPVIKTIAEIQGDNTDTSPLAGTAVTTTGVVTASYPAGGLAGFDIQTGGTPNTPDASDGVFVFADKNLTTAQYPAVGTTVTVTGTVTEYYGLTEVNVAAPADVVTAATPQAPVVPLTTVPGTDCTQGSCPTKTAVDTAREVHESELYQPTSHYTVTDPYDGSPSPSTSSSNFGEIGLAAELSTPLVSPTEDYDAQTQATQIADRTLFNTDHEINVDDASSLSYTTAANTSLPMPWFTATHDVRVGAAVTFPKPVVLSYGNAEWRLEPQAQVVGNSDGVVDFEQTRAPYANGPAAVGGNLKLATFNVLNFFPTTGVDYVAGGLGSCTYYNDRQGNKVTTNSCGNPTTSSGNGPRGAADAANLQRQQDKIVHAINKLGADVVSLEEVENSVVFGKDRDSGLQTLVTALNADAGAGTWAFAPSPAPADLPATSDQDVIRTAFIYKPATVSLVGASKVLTGSAAFANAREPLAQAFKAVDTRDASAFGVIVNHFKSKGSGADDSTGQGNANPDRVNQANDLLTFSDDFKTARGISKMFLVGDFNAYSHEDPVQVLEGGGYTAVNDTKAPIDKSYSFSGQNGSLDHVFANDAALGTVTGADVWGINAFESVYYEYSRYNYNVTNLYDTSPFRASDHNPEIVGLDTTPKPVTLNLLNINDFHGRIDAAVTTKWATTIEQLRAAGGAGNTLLLSAGDNIGASLFASASKQDNPTIDVLNALGLNGSAVGNHELDQGFADLTGHVNDRASWDYLGANVYNKDGSAALPQYATYVVSGVTVGVVGAVTQETPSLVSPAGIQGLTFGDPVDAVNRVTTQLTDGNTANGEADVIVAEYHEGAPNGDVEKATLESNLAASPVFTKIVNQTSPKVAAIFTGHTHKKYAYSAPVPGSTTGATRPVVQTGNYGDFVGHVTLTFDPSTNTVTAHTQENVAKATTEDLSYPRVAEVKKITDQALADAATLGNQPVGTITADITTAFTGGSIANGKYTGGTRDDRASESTLGDLVAQALKDGVSQFGSPDLGITNPGGLRAELLFAGDTTSNQQNTDGVVTYGEANSVLPFNNTVALVKLTGAQIKAVLEQQYQTNPDGTVPSRPYLQLGLSSNVRVTTDASKAAGSRITSVYIDDVPLDPTKTYTVSTLSFLAAGGDNFRAFTGGTSTDTGLLDAQLFRDYFQAHPGLAPDFARQQVTESGKPTQLTTGQPATFTLSKLDLTSQSSPQNTTLTATIGGTTIGTYAVTNGTAAVTVTVPTSYTAPGVVTFTAAPSGTKVTVPFVPGSTPPPTTSPSTVTGTAATFTYGQTGTVHVTVTGNGATPTGTVTLSDGTTPLGTATLANGAADITLAAKSLTPGSHPLTLRYTGDTAFDASSSSVAVTVAKASPTVTATAIPSSVQVGSGTTRVSVDVTAQGYTPTGTIEVRDSSGALLGTGALSGGSATVQVGPFDTAGTQELTVKYLGDDNASAASGLTSVEVIKAAATVTATVTPATVTVNEDSTAVRVVVTSDGPTPTGLVRLSEGNVTLGSSTLANGRVSIRVRPFSDVGTHTLTATYEGDDNTATSRDTVTVKVLKQEPSIKIDAPDKVKQGATPDVEVTIKTRGGDVTGKVRISYRGTTDTAKLVHGKVVFTLDRLQRPGRVKLTVEYLGDDTHRAISDTTVITVQNKKK